MMTVEELRSRRALYDQHAMLLAKARRAPTEQGAMFWHTRADRVQGAIDLLNAR